METIRRFFVESWRSKLVSLLIALSIWHLIRSHLDGERRDFPVPGTVPVAPVRPATGPVLDESLLGPLIPVPLPSPARIPVPGGATEN